MYICSVFAQMERETTAERVRDAMLELAKLGAWSGGRAPLGFNRKRIEVGGKSHVILVENAKEKAFLNMVADTFLQGFSLSGLETYFRKNNVKTIDGYYLSASQLHNILKNPHYAMADEKTYNYFLSLGCTMACD